jgi:hypothetical protein
MHFAFSSDSWFFADISGIETVKNLLFAKRAIDLLELEDGERVLREYLQQAPSNVLAYGNGLGVWQKLVKPQVYEPTNHSQNPRVFTSFGGKNPWAVGIRSSRKKRGLFCEAKGPGDGGNFLL